MPWQGGLVPIPVRMTVLRLADGRLVLHSPVPLDAPLRAALAALGPVGFIVIPLAHGRFAGAAAAAYPNARLLAAPRPARRRRSLPFAGDVADEPPPEWAGEIETLLVRGFRLEEVLLYHVPSRTLVVTDLCFHIHTSGSRVARAFFRANGMWRRFGPSRLIRRLAVSDRRAFRASLEQASKWTIDRIVPGHGDVLENPASTTLLEAWRL